MAFEGYLLKIGDYIVPEDKFIKAESYSSYVNMQDIDDWTDGDGYLHREPVELKALKVEFETPAMLTNAELTELLTNIDNNIVDIDGNGCYITAYIPRYDKYYTQYGYMADIQPQMHDLSDGVIHYNSIKFSFIGGVSDD